MDSRDDFRLRAYAAEKEADDLRAENQQLREVLEAVVDHMIPRTNDEGAAYDKVLAALQGGVVKECDHNWVCGDNEVVSGLEVCTKCKHLRTAQGGDKDE